MVSVLETTYRQACKNNAFKIKYEKQHVLLQKQFDMVQLKGSISAMQMACS